MDYNTLVNEIVKRVAQKMSEFESKSGGVNFAANSAPCKQKLLILTPQHGEKCHEIYESESLKANCEIDCALEQNYNVDVEKYDAVILFGFTVELLCRLSGGVCDTPFSSLAQKAILLDKKIIVPKEEVELYNYRPQSRKNEYYAFLENKLSRLLNCGITICPCAEIEGKILANCSGGSKAVAASFVQSSANLCTVKLTKKVVTEKDMAAAKANKAGTVCVAKKAILTDLAKEYANKYSLTIVREDA